jgi:hypothetical protein
MIVMWPLTALNKAGMVLWNQSCHFFMKTKCKSNVLELYLYLVGLTNWIVSSLKLIIKTNADHRIQQSHWPEKRNLQAYTQPYSAAHWKYWSLSVISIGLLKSLETYRSLLGAHLTVSSLKTTEKKYSDHKIQQLHSP